MSDAVIITKEILNFLTPLISVYVAIKMAQLSKVAGKTHTLVNSNMGIQLKLNAGNSQIVAELRGRPEDIEAAKLAEKMLTEHEGKQAQVDAGISK